MTELNRVLNREKEMKIKKDSKLDTRERLIPHSDRSGGQSPAG
jgi:hypothetical protein